MQRDRIYLPLEDLERFGYEEADVFGGVVNEPFQQLVRFQAQRAREYFGRGRELLPLLPRRSRACTAVLQGIYSRILERIEASPATVMRERVSLTSGEKLALAGKKLLGSLVA